MLRVYFKTYFASTLVGEKCQIRMRRNRLVSSSRRVASSTSHRLPLFSFCSGFLSTRQGKYLNTFYVSAFTYNKQKYYKRNASLASETNKSQQASKSNIY